MLKKIKLSILVLLLNCLSVAHAEIITEYWYADVINTTHTAAAAIGETLSWSVTYDDEGRYMRQYADGSDGIAQTADDSLNILWDVTAPAYSVDWNVFSDATFDFGNIWEKMEQVVIDSSLGFRDAYNINEFLFYGADDKNRYEYVADHKDLFLVDNFDPALNDTARFNVYYRYTDHSPQSVRIDIGNFRIADAPVPAPSALSILVLGISSLLYRRKKHNLVASA